MKRGKDEEKIMGPMFPRLHVNDTEKGGPRAPPRNKMALYEQLSIPSQRFNTRSLLHNANSTINLTPPSSSQGSGHERGMFLPLQRPPSVQPAVKPTRYADLSPSLVQIEPKTRQEEEDFMVPIFVQSNMDQDHNENYNSIDKERHTPSGTAYSGCFAKFQNTNEKELKQFDTSGLNLRPEGSRQTEGNSKEIMMCREKLNNSQSNQKSREKSEIPLKQINISSSFEHMNHPPKYFHKLKDTNDCLRHEYKEGLQLIKTVRNDGVSVDQSRGLDYENSSIHMGDIQQEVHRSPHHPTNDAESHEDNCRSLPTGIMDRGDDVSETSMVDSVSGTDLSPDDVVGIIGQKHFWKARRAIVNQQRVFAVQVFELHRLIKVQKLIAESPHILLEDAAYLGKTLKGSPAKKISLDYIVKATPKIVKHKDVSEKPDSRMESSAENAVEKTSLLSLQNGSQPSNYSPFLGIPPQATVTSDTKMGPWGFNQPSGHHWLVPVMTPSEGLVYKPYPGPGFMGPVYGPPGSTPMMGSYLNYGVPIPHHPYQGLGPASFTPPAGHGYFPPFGMPILHPSFSGSVEQTDHPNMQYQASCNVPSQKNGSVPNSAKLNPSKDSEVQFSMASSPSERAQTTRAAHTSEGKNALSLFPTSPVFHVPDGGSDQPSRVIKVVPHNARSATESVARIFQSIQEERKQFDSI